MTAVRKSGEIMDKNGEMVHRFALTMNNLGLAKAVHELETMLDSDRWRKFSFGGMTFEFLLGEFDYFLTQQGVTREQVMGVRDVAVKARLEEHMDERRTGEEGYRRSITEVRSQVPERPGSPIIPFGYTEKEAKFVVDNNQGRVVRHRRALGDRVRRYNITGGKTTKHESEFKPRWERLLMSVSRLPDDELAKVLDGLKEEQRRRHRG